MNVFIRVLCVVVLMLSPVLAGAMGRFGSKESIQKADQAPAEPSKTGSLDTPSAKADPPGDAGSAQSPVSADSSGRGASQSQPLVPSLPPPSGPGISQTGDKVPTEALPARGTTLPEQTPKGSVSPGLPSEVSLEQSKQAVTPSAHPQSSVVPQTSPPLPLTGKTKTAPLTDKTAEDSQPVPQPRLAGSESHPLAPLPVAPAPPVKPEEFNSAERPAPAQDPAAASGEALLSLPTVSATVEKEPKSSANSIRNRFEKFDTFPGSSDWKSTDCGCVPVLPSFETYGFYPPSEGAKVGPVNFGIWSRIGYYAATPSEKGRFELPPSPNVLGGGKIQPALVAHRYGTKLDLVVKNNRWASPTGKNGLALDKSIVLIELVDNIVSLVTEMEFDGVTIDFDLSTVEMPSQQNYVQAYVLFIERLNKALKAKNKDYRLHIVLEYYKDETGKKLPRLFAKDDLKQLYDSVDLFLFLPNYEGGEGKQAMKQYDDYFEDYEYGEIAGIEKKLLFIVEPDRVFDEIFDIRGDRFGGVGSWLLGPSSETDPVGLSFAATLTYQKRTQDFVTFMEVDPIPSPFCTLVCPNRTIIVGVAVVLTVICAGVVVVAFFSPIVAKGMHKYLIYVVVGSLLVVVLIGVLLLCVSQWSSGWETELTVLTLSLAGGYVLKSVRDKRREANYP